MMTLDEAVAALDALRADREQARQTEAAALQELGRLHAKVLLPIMRAVVDLTGKPCETPEAILPALQSLARLPAAPAPASPPRPPDPRLDVVKNILREWDLLGLHPGRVHGAPWDEYDLYAGRIVDGLDRPAHDGWYAANWSSERREVVDDVKIEELWTSQPCGKVVPPSAQARIEIAVREMTSGFDVRIPDGTVQALSRQIALETAILVDGHLQRADLAPEGSVVKMANGDIATKRYGAWMANNRIFSSAELRSQRVLALRTRPSNLPGPMRPWGSRPEANLDAVRQQLARIPIHATHANTDPRINVVWSALFTWTPPGHIVSRSHAVRITAALDRPLPVLSMVVLAEYVSERQCLVDTVREVPEPDPGSLSAHDRLLDAIMEAVLGLDATQRMERLRLMRESSSETLLPRLKDLAADIAKRTAVIVDGRLQNPGLAPDGTVVKLLDSDDVAVRRLGGKTASKVHGEGWMIDGVMHANVSLVGQPVVKGVRHVILRS